MQEEAIGGCRLICGDAADVLPTLPMVDVVITDPPYHGLQGGLDIGSDGVAPLRQPAFSVGSQLGNAHALGLVRHLARYAAIAFCSYQWVEECAQLLGGTRKALVPWIQRNRPAALRNVPKPCVEYAWVVEYAAGISWRGFVPYLDVPMLHAGCFPGERLTLAGKSLHPTQKPLAVMAHFLLPGMESVCDPYMGTGTLGVACLRTGRHFVGIERDAGYFDLACQRIEEAYRQPELLPPSPVAMPAYQLGLLEED